MDPHPLHSVMQQMVLGTLQVLMCKNSLHFTLNTCKDALNQKKFGGMVQLKVKK